MELFAIKVRPDTTATVRSATLFSVFGTGTAAAGGTTSAGLNTSLTVLDSILWNVSRGFASTASAGHSVITANYVDFSGGASGGLNADVNLGANIDPADPFFVDPGSGGDYRLRFGSPAIDSGGDCAMPCQTILDLQGLTRPIDGNGDGLRSSGHGRLRVRAPTPVAAARVDRSSALTENFSRSAVLAPATPIRGTPSRTAGASTMAAPRQDRT